METKRYKNWWFLAVNGIIAILFGLLLLLFTKEVIQTIVFSFGVVILAAGLILFFTAVYQIKKEKGVGMLLFQSILSVAIGIIIMLFTKDSLRFFLILIGVWAVIVGIMQLVVLINVKRNLSNKNIFLFNGLLTIVMGVILFLDPFAIAGFVVTLTGIFSIVFGLVLIYLSFALRTIASSELKEPEAK